MAYAAVREILGETLAAQAAVVFARKGTDTESAIRIWVKQSVDEELSSLRPQGCLQRMAENMPHPTEAQRQQFKESIERCQQAAAANGLSDMTLEDINREIALSRAGR